VDLFHEPKDDKIAKGLEKYFKELENRENKL
jgi:ribosomal protein L7Ae-like RNA K-turn-binding protein